MLDLFYFVQLHVVAVQAFGHSAAAAAIPIPIDHVLHALYANDDGLACPGEDGIKYAFIPIFNFAIHAVCDLIFFCLFFSFFLVLTLRFNTAFGRPFCWLQALCGLGPIALGPSSFKSKVDELFTKIIDKVSIEMCLLFQFDFLSMIH
jgi:hypothetical protein